MEYSEYSMDGEYINSFFKDQTVLVLGSAPNVLATNLKIMNNIKYIVRVNNYKLFNACRRTDVYASFMGKSIRKSYIDLRTDGCKLMMFKCPNENIIVKNSEGVINTKLSNDFRWIYEFRDKWIKEAKIPYYIQTVDNFNNNNKLLGQVATTGVGVILDILRCSPRYLYFSGFDFGMSKMHNINKKMIIKPEPNCHHFEDEFYLMKRLMGDRENLDCSPEIKELFTKEYKRD
jgi:hypothetical protein